MTGQNTQIAISEATYRTALNLAQAEDKLLGQVIEPFLDRAINNSTPNAYFVYTVQRGDSLGRIARNFYGDAYKYPLLQQANNINNPGKIRVL